MKKPFPPHEPPVALESKHDCSTFDCGVTVLNDYLRKFALTNQKNDSSRTYVSLRDDRILGYYSLAAGSINREAAPVRVAKGLPAHPVPVVLLARLAVTLDEQGNGLGAAL